MGEISSNEGMKITVDLENQQITTGKGALIRFEIDDFRKNNLLQGLDEIGLTLQHEDRIDAFEARQKQQLPWLWN